MAFREENQARFLVVYTPARSNLATAPRIFGMDLSGGFEHSELATFFYATNFLSDI